MRGGLIYVNKINKQLHLFKSVIKFDQLHIKRKIKSTGCSFYDDIHIRTHLLLNALVNADFV